MSDEVNVERLLETAVDEVPAGRADSRRALSERVRRQRARVAAAWLIVAVVIGSSAVAVDAQFRSPAVVEFVDGGGGQATAASTATPGVRDERRGHLPDGTSYVLRGDGADALVPTAASGYLMLDDTRARHLGALEAYRWTPESGAQRPAPEPVHWDGDRLVGVAPPWQFEIRRGGDPAIVASPALREIVAGSITASVRAGHLVLSVDGPVRFARDDEVPVQLDVEYEGASFWVADGSGCGADPHPTLVCSPDGRVSLEFPNQRAARGWSIARPSP